MRRHFPKDYKGKIIGAVTPQWMEYPKLFHEWFPEAKIIMITRNPKERAYSHYRMMVRREEEKRSFVEILGQKIIWQEEIYTKMSDYKRWIHKWEDWWYKPKIITLENMIRNPKKEIDKIHRFLKVEIFQSATLGKAYNVGYDKMNLVMKFLKRLPIRHLIPQSIKRRIWWFLEMTGGKK